MKSEGELLYHLLEDTKENEIEWFSKEGSTEKSNYDYFYCSIVKIKKETTIKLYFKLMDNYIEESNMANYLCYVDVYMKKNDKKPIFLFRIKRDQLAIQELLGEVLIKHNKNDIKKEYVDIDFSKDEKKEFKFTKEKDIKKDQEIIYLSNGKKIKTITISDSEKLKIPIEIKSYNGYFTYRVFIIGTISNGRQSTKRIYWNSDSKIWIYNKDISVEDKNKITNK